MPPRKWWKAASPNRSRNNSPPSTASASSSPHPREEVSRITIEFNLDRDPDEAANDVRDRVSRARDRLPDEVDEPIIAKEEADANPVLWLTFTSDRFSRTELTDLVDRIAKQRIQTVPGVGTIFIGGERRYAMRLWLDPDKLASYQLTATDVEDALREQNVDVPGGRIESFAREFTVRTQGELADAAAFEELIVATRGNSQIKLKDVGRAELGSEDYRTRMFFNGVPTVGLGVVRQSKSNLLEVADGVKKLIPVIEAELPEGIDVEVGYDSSVFVQRSVDEVYKTFFEAFLIVIVVIFLFLRDWRAVVIPITAIPISIIGTFAVISALGLLDQHPHAAGAGAGHRPGGGRCHRDVGKHLPPHRGRRNEDPGLRARRAAGGLRHHRLHPHAGRGVPARGLPIRHHRPPVLRVRHLAGGLGDGLDGGLANGHADALLADAQGRRSEDRPSAARLVLSGHRTGLRIRQPRVRQTPAGFAQGMAGRHPAVIGIRRAGALCLQGTPARTHADGGPRQFHLHLQRTARFASGLHVQLCEQDDRRDRAPAGARTLLLRHRPRPRRPGRGQPGTRLLHPQAMGGTRPSPPSRSSAKSTAPMPRKSPAASPSPSFPIRSAAAA